MCAAGHPRAERHGRAVHVVESERHEASAHADDVGDRVERADLVEVNVVDGRAVYGGFGLGQSSEHQHGTVAHGHLEPGQQRLDVGEATVVGGLADLDMHLRRRERAALHPLRRHLDRQPRVERIDRSSHVVEVDTGIDEAAEQHVAAHTGGRVDPADHRSNRRSMRTAAQAAPNPLSTLTTVTPCAQLASALCSAAVPPVATP